MGIDRKKSISAPVDVAEAELRRRAEERLSTLVTAAGRPRLENEAQVLLHELQVHQIELEMQNAELRQARDNLEKALEKYTDLYDFAPVGYFTLDREGAIHAVNLSGAGLLGIERSRLTGRHFGQFVTEEHRPAFNVFLGKVFTSQGKEASEVAIMNEKHQLLFVQIQAVTTASMQECRLALIDITERKRADAEIQRLASFPIMNPNPILEVDASGHLTYCNPAAKRFLGNGGATNSINPFLPPDMPVLLRELQSRKAGDYSREMEVGGRFFRELIYIAPPFETVRIYTMDITNRKRAEEEVKRLNADLADRAAELEAANIELDAFNHSVSHDLRRPLTVINSYCQVVMELCSNKLDAQCRKFILDMYKGSQRMNHLIDTLLKFASVTRVEMRQESVDLSAMAHAVATELKLAAPENRVTFRIADGIVTEGDPDLMRVVLDNIIGNAWKYAGTREEAIIEFGLTEADGKPACFVRDNGPGFDMALADKLFLPFQRLSGADIEGHGIGLATVERIVRRHGGRTWAESKPGEGATFFFTFA